MVTDDGMETPDGGVGRGGGGGATAWRPPEPTGPVVGFAVGPVVPVRMDEGRSPGCVVGRTGPLDGRTGPLGGRTGPVAGRDLGASSTPFSPVLISASSGASSSACW